MVKDQQSSMIYDVFLGIMLKETKGFTDCAFFSFVLCMEATLFVPK